MIIDEHITVKWSGTNKEHYTDKGYIFTKYLDFITVSVDHLSRGSSVEVRYECDKCGVIKNTKYNKITNSTFYIEKKETYCVKCATTTRKKKTHESFVKEVFELVGNEYKVIGQYEGTNSYILMRHELCGYEWPLQPANFLNNRGKGTRCPKCAGLLKRDINSFREEVKACSNDEYEVLSNEYINTMSLHLVRHKVCEYEYEVTPDNFIVGGKRCPKCAGLLKLDIETVKNRVSNLVGEEYSVIGDYINTNSKIKFRHNSNYCNNNEFDMIVNNFLLRGQRCPVCAESKGEQSIRKFLEMRKFTYSKQHSFDDLKGRFEKLRFDFAVFFEDNLKVLIEYDGEFHYFEVFEDVNLELAQEYDELKNNYCKSKDIKLIRIPYWEYENIESILTKELERL